MIKLSKVLGQHTKNLNKRDKYCNIGSSNYLLCNKKKKCGINSQAKATIKYC